MFYLQKFTVLNHTNCSWAVIDEFYDVLMMLLAVDGVSFLVHKNVHLFVLQ